MSQPNPPALTLPADEVKDLVGAHLLRRMLPLPIESEEGDVSEFRRYCIPRMARWTAPLERRSSGGLHFAADSFLSWIP